MEPSTWRLVIILREVSVAQIKVAVSTSHIAHLCGFSSTLSECAQTGIDTESTIPMCLDLLKPTCLLLAPVRFWKGI